MISFILALHLVPCLYILNLEKSHLIIQKKEIIMHIYSAEKRTGIEKPSLNLKLGAARSPAMNSKLDCLLRHIEMNIGHNRVRVMKPDTSADAGPEGARLTSSLWP